MLKNIKFLDFVLFFAAVILAAIGIVVIFSITSGTEGPRYHILQIIYASFGLILFFLLSLIDYRLLKGASFILYVLGIALLLVVLFLGKGEGGAARWINFGLFYLQPSEIFKIIAIIYFSAYLSSKEDPSIRETLVYLILVAIPMVLIMLEPDLGTAVVIFVIGMTILFISNIKKIYLLVISGIGLLFVPLSWFALRDYQKERILTFLTPSRDPFGAGYNVAQSIIAIGSGQFMGKGLGHGSQSQLNFLPARHTDFIFATLAEELGFLGASIVVILFLTIIIRAIYIAGKARDVFGRYVAFGVATVILLQVFVNIGMNLGLMPITGIPLPFVSFGGSSLLTFFIALGVLSSIYLRHRKLSFEQ